MTTEVLKLLSDPTKSEELYALFEKYVLSPDDLVKWGYPVEDPDKPGYAKCIPIPEYNTSLNPEDQKCRCGKPVSLLDENWYIDEDGCNYHPGKRLKNSKKETNQAERYTCCQKNLVPGGCVNNKFHVSSFHPVAGVLFLMAAKKARSCKWPPNIYSLDCEMVFTTGGMEAAKVTVVSILGDIVYDTYIQPTHTILDYNTRYSGITERHLEGVTTSLRNVQNRLFELFDVDTILIGHGLENDLLSLNFVHGKIIDTAVVFPHKKGFPYRLSLKKLASTYLGLSVHRKAKGHDSIQDAKICSELLLCKI